MPGLGNDLVVNLAGNNSKLKSKIAESKGGLQSFASAAKGFLNPVVAGLTAVTGAAIGTGVAVYGLTSRIEALDKVAKDAARSGISGAFLQQLTFAADQSGVAADKVIDALKDMTIKIGQAESGNVALVESFKQLGLSVDDLRKMSPEKQFRTIFENISKLPTAAQRSAAAVTAFGEAGHQMTTLFSGGVGKLNVLLDRAKQLGIGIDAEGLKKISAANDALGQMKAAFVALLDQVTVGVAPAFELIATKIADWIPPVTKFFEKLNGLEDKVGFAGDLLAASMDVGIETIKAHWADMLNEMVDQVKSIPWEKLLNPFAGIKMADLKVGDQGQGLAAAQQRLQGVMGRLGPDDQGLIRGKLPALGGKPKDVPTDGSGLASLAGSLAESATSLFDQAAQAAQNKLTDLKIKGGYVGSVVKNMFAGDGKEKKAKPEAVKEEMRFAGVMQKGSAEAYSTIVQAMFRGKDPNVQATEKQTGVLVKAMKDNKPKFNMVGAFG